MITNNVIGTTNTTLFTAAGMAAITLITFCNTGAAVDQITLYAVPSGGSVGNAQTIMKSHRISPNRTFLLNLEKFILATGDTIVAISTAGTVSATVSVMPLT